MRLRCGECQVWREVTVTNAVAERFDVELDRRADLIHRALAKLDRERMVQQAETMIGALRHGLIEPARLRPPRHLDLQALVLEVELALDPVHDVVGDRARVAQPHDLARAGPPAPRAPSSGRRPSGPRSPRPRPCPRAPPAAACGTRTSPRMRSSVSSRVHSSLASSSMPRQRGLAWPAAGLQLLARLRGAVVDHAEPADQRRQRQPLQDERDEDHRERQEDDQVALREVRRRAPAPPRARRRRASRPSRRRCGPARSPRRARCDSRRSSARITNTIVCCQTSRVSTTAALTAAA